MLGADHADVLRHANRTQVEIGAILNVPGNRIASHGEAVLGNPVRTPPRAASFRSAAVRNTPTCKDGRP